MIVIIRPELTELPFLIREIFNHASVGVKVDIGF